jgi:hypothetical protein
MIRRSRGAAESPLEWVARTFPVDGPHDAAQMIAAGSVLAKLCRYLAHATMPHPAGLPAPQLYSVLGELAAASGSMEQVCRQLAACANTLRTDPTLRADDMGEPRLPRELAIAARRALDAAQVMAGALARALARAQEPMARLYHDDDGAGGVR